MTYEEALAYLENYTWSKTKLGLDRTRELCAKMGNPQKKLKFIHVGGSNGKGSTCAMLASVLEAAGCRTGLYTSPYIQTFCERIQINGENIHGSRLAEITEKLRDAAESMDDHPSWFEMVTAAAFQYYMEEQCDIVVLEVGMGGEFDSTNVIDAPEVAVLTNIGLEHTEYLGDTIEAIAATKSGIIKPGCDVVSYDNSPEVKSIVAEAAEKSGASLVFADPNKITLHSRDLSGQSFGWEGSEYKLPLHGEHQLKNASVVMEAIRALQRRGWEIPDEAVRRGLAEVKWPARFQILAGEPLFILDGGHNPQCAKAACQCFADLLPGQMAEFLLGVLSDKDYTQMIDILGSYAASFHCIAPENERALDVSRLADTVRLRGLDAYIYNDLSEAINGVLQSAADNNRPVMCFGSLYLAGEILNEFCGIYKEWLRKRKIKARKALTEGERDRFSAKICRRISEMPEFAEAKNIMIYNWIRGEVRLDRMKDIAAAKGKRVLYPVCDESGGLIAVGPCSDDAIAAVAPGGDAENTSVEALGDNEIAAECSDAAMTDAELTAERIAVDTPIRGEMAVAHLAAEDRIWRSGPLGILEPNPNTGTVTDPEDIDLVVCPCTSFDKNCNRLGMGGGYYDRFLSGCTNATTVAVAFEVQKSTQIPVEEHDISVDAVITESCTYRRVKN